MRTLDLFSGETKEETAIRFLRENEPPEGYFLGFSGGKDSVVCHDLCKIAGVKFAAYYSATGIDPPEVTRFIRRHYSGVVWKRPKLNFWAGILKKQFPTKFRRWCCDELKKKPTRDVPLKNRIMGIRAEESNRRASRPNPDYNKRLKQWTFKPIFGWKSWEIWEYIERHKLAYCELYDQGFDRIGCVICPFLCRPNQGKLNQHKARWPRQYAMFEKTMRKYFELKGHKLREKTAEELLCNWYRGN